MGKITIDSREIEFNQGQTIIEAAADNNIDIPHFCWHPSLSVSGNCRMCLVEVEKMPKLVIACSTLAADGMQVKVNSEKALDARKAVMEFILINHPLDCPICDEAGECKLQDYTFSHSVGESRFVEEKVHKQKRVPLGPHVMFDAERCISCSRCIRFSDEIAKENQLTFVKRGDRVTITTFPEKEFDNPYSLNVVDICPVGALTNRDFRFKARVWDMSHTNSICSGCARGCNIDVWVRNNEILRLTPRFNPEVNSHWMCDHGRLNTFKFVNSETRIDGPHIRRDGLLIQVDWNTALSEAARKIKSLKSHEIAFIGSAYASLEDNYLFGKFVKSVVNSQNLDFVRHIIADSEDDILIKSDKTPNSLGAEIVGIIPGKSGIGLEQLRDSILNGKIKGLYIMEEDLSEFFNDIESLVTKLDWIIIHASNKNSMIEYSDIVLPAATYAEKNGVFVNFEGIAQRIRPAVTLNEHDRSIEGMALSRLDKFGTQFDRWGTGKKIDALPSWKIILKLSNLLGTKFKFDMAEEIFEEISQNIVTFNGMDYDLLGDKGMKIKSIPGHIKIV